MGNCCQATSNYQKGMINLNDLTNKPQSINNEINNNQNNDDCSILISSTSLEQNYNVKYRESNTIKIFEKNQSLKTHKT